MNNLGTIQEGSTTGDAELIDIRTGYDGSIYESAGDAVRSQIERYSNGERNAVLTTGATADERAVFDNLSYIKAYGIDLSGYYLSTVVNTEQYPFKFILKKSDNSGDRISMNTDGNKNFCYYKSDDSFVIIGYNWSTHTNDINLNYNDSHIKILDSIHSTDSVIDYLNGQISDIESNIADIDNDVQSMHQTANEELFSLEPTETGTVFSEIQNAYMAGSPIKIYSLGNDNKFKCTVYSVTAGSTYKFISENYSLGGELPAVVFTTTAASTNTSVLLENPVVIYSAYTNNRAVDFTYSCLHNGYVVVAWTATRGELKMYETENISRINNLHSRVTAIENNTDNLGGKTIAILGDSIMMLMRNNYSGTNTVSYLGSDGNTYTYDQLTNINGKLYVTSDNSISCEVVNSDQSKLDTQNWDALKEKTGAADIINCGLGAGRVTEKEIITEYPYPDGDRRTNCLSNEVRMLNRLVQGGRDEPDCILIWIGTNDANNSNSNNIVADNFDEVMALDYNTIADDTLGRTYRQTFYGGLRYSLETLIRNYPYATIMVFTPVQTNPANQRTYENLIVVGNALKKMANRYSCIYVNALTDIGIVDLLEASDGSGFFLADGLHPNSDGKKLLANFTAKKLNTLYFSKR